MTPNPEREQTITVEQVRQVAALCRIGLTDEEAERLRGEMAGLLDEVSVLQEIDAAGVEPTAHPFDDQAGDGEADDDQAGSDQTGDRQAGGDGAGLVGGVMREDEPRPPMEREETLANAPRRDGPYFRVQAVMDES